MSADGGAGGQDRHGERLAVLETKMSGVEADVATLQGDVSGLKRFQAWMLGVGSAFGAIATLLAQSIKGRLGLG